MKKHLLYAKYLARHKWFVFLAGLKLGVPLWRLIIHDWSKFLPCEWFPYARYFFRKDGPLGNTKADRAAFERAWLHHIHLNKHHWNYWVLVDGPTTEASANKAISMPDVYIREMVADWCGAGRAITGKWDVYNWFAKNVERMTLHDTTKFKVGYVVMEAKEKLK